MSFSTDPTDATTSNGTNPSHHHQAHLTSWQHTGDPALKTWMDAVRSMHRPEEDSVDAILLDI